MADREKISKGLECHRIDNNHRINCADCPYYVDDDNHIRCVNDLHDDALELLKEQEEQVEQWTKEIADNQLAHAPNDSPMSLDEQLECEYKRGIWDGLEIAWNIISEGR